MPEYGEQPSAGLVSVYRVRLARGEVVTLTEVEAVELVACLMALGQNRRIVTLEGDSVSVFRERRPGP